MSEESPWGAPPPSPSYGPPPSPFPTGPTQPPANQPPVRTGGGQWGPPPSYGGPPQGPYGQPPRKRNTGAIIAAMLGVVVVAAAIVVTLVVKGGDDETATDATTTSATTDGSPETSGTPETSDTPETSTTPESSSAAVDVPKGAVEGQQGGYYFELPGAAWSDAYDEASKKGLGATLDSFIILGTSIPNAQSNILAEALAAPFADTPEDLEEQWKRNLSGGDDAVPQDVPDITIDGEHAIGVKFVDRVNDAGLTFNQRAYLVLHNGSQYSILLTFPADGDFVSEDDFDKVLDSWRWTS